MKTSKRKVTKSSLLLTVTLLVLTAFMLNINLISAQAVLTLTVTPSKESFSIRELITISGEVMDRGAPATDCIVSIEARNPRDNPLLFRTIPIGNPSQLWSIEILDVYLKDIDGNATDNVVINSMTQLYAKVQNTLLNNIGVVITATVLDGNSISIFAGWQSTTIPPQSERTFSWSVYVPEWAYSGKARAFINVYTDFPQDGGTPYTPEAEYVFHITRNPELPHPYSVLPATYVTLPGEYQIYFRTSPDRFALPGDYSIYATATPGPPYQAFNSTLYGVESDPCPPQAAFTYLPLEILANMTVTFDASSSSAEGYNDTIISYEWTINDPNDPQHIVKTGTFTNPPDPTVEHAFAIAGTYTVELNVTDTENLWSTTAKPVTILPEYGPTANFTWTPSTPNVNGTVHFDASSSQLGWSAQIADYAPIIQYRWNFSDGIIITTGDSLVDHVFTDPGNFTVILRITDSVGRTDSIAKTVEVENVTRRIYDVAEPYGIIDMRDVATVARQFGTSEGDPDWDPIADITGPTGEPDGVVDMRDVALVAVHFGETY
jgi:hypothetical protein